MISPLAYIDPTAKIGANVEVKPFAYIDKDVVIGDDCTIMSHASILAGTTMGKGNIVFENAVIGATPQDFHYVEGTPTHTVIGDNNRFRENTVIAGGSKADTATHIGSGNFFMDKVHVCHDVTIKDHCILGINSSVAGSCQVDSSTILSTGVVLQEHVHVGTLSLIQSGCRVQKGVPPYIVMGGNPASYHGINTYLLEHFGVTDRILRHIANAYRIIYTSNFSLEDSVIKIREQIPMSKEIEDILDFISSSKQGIVRNMD